MKRRIVAVDLFAGGGGTSTGLTLACKRLGMKIELTAINHWKEAIETHEKNHPWAKHLCEDIAGVNPRKVVTGGHLDILVASPECTSHSKAAGGRPKNDQSRASAWYIMRWLELLSVDNLLIENVPEFRDFGPLGADGRPIRHLRGTIYEEWIRVIKAFGYNVDARVLNAADYGAPTSRSRLFVLARRENRPIVWPRPTHSKNWKGAKRWRAAREIIDWSIEGGSIFTRKRPLKPRTIARIIEGLRRFGGPELQPFIVLMKQSGRNGPSVRSVDDPLPTITTARGGSMGLVEPSAFILSQGSNGAPKSVEDDPVPSILTAGKHALVRPFILSQGSGGAPRSVDDPVATIPGKGAHSLIVPFFGERGGRRPRAQSIEDPLAAVTSHGAGGLAEAFIVEYHGGKNTDGHKRVSSVDGPLKTIDTANRFGLARPFILPVEGYYHREGQNRAKSVDDPLGTITQRGYGHVVEPFLTQYNGNSGVQSVEDPLPTVPTKDRFALVQPEINGRRLDIKFRMLQPHELAGAMTFPRNYLFIGTKTERVKMIGNAVVVRLAQRLCESLLSR